MNSFPQGRGEEGFLQRKDKAPMINDALNYYKLLGSVYVPTYIRYFLAV